MNLSAVSKLVALVLVTLVVPLTSTALGQAGTFASGTVVDETGAPVVGASVSGVTKTDSSGHFVMAISAGERRINVLADGFDPKEQVITVVAGRPAFGLEFVLHRSPNARPVPRLEPAAAAASQTPPGGALIDVAKKGDSAQAIPGSSAESVGRFGLR